MQLICPCCQTAFPIEAGINDVNARNAIKRAFSLTPIGDQLLAYVQLFKPESRVLSMTKLTKLLDELVEMIKEGKIKRNGRTWPAPQAYWQQAIDQMLSSRDQLNLPLKSHGYLFTIISGYADKTEGKVEEQSEARKVGGSSQRHQEQPKTRGIPADVRGKLNEFLNKTTI